MHAIIKSYLFDETGAAAAEYALVLSIIGVTLAAAVFTSDGDISSALTKVRSAIAAHS
jgi:pilus assembly protein Flp/PilA